MTYDYDTGHDSPNYTRAADCPRVFGYPRKITSITIHWWGDPKTKPTHDGVVDYLCRKGGSSSAHDVISAGRVSCIVDPDDAAWHAGNGRGNTSSIGLELDPRADDGTYATAAERIAEYRAVYGDAPLVLVPHKRWKATACPGVYDLERLDREARAAATGDKPAPKPKPTPKPKPARLKVDGKWGAATTRRLQQVTGAPYDDGEISRQADVWRADNPGCTTGWQWDGRSGDGGSPTIKRVQKRVGVKQDGKAGPVTFAAMQDHYGTEPDGEVWKPSPMVRAMQRALNEGKF